MWKDEILKGALEFATIAHNGQTMICPEGVPYSMHFCGVCFYAIKYSIGDEVDWDLLVQVALLHDVLEDTDVTYDQLNDRFGIRVADGVGALSKNNLLPKELQMSDCIKRIKTQPKEIAAVKLADRLFNMRARVAAWSEEKQENYKKEAQLICDELGYASAKLKEALQKAIDVY